ncbi:MAG: hypothetical protein GY711_34230 [bacterium]|nr:hypothetical protein [bacterium]
MIALLPLLLAAPSLSAPPDVKLPAVFGDHMVLQRETEAPVWGWATAGETITVSGSWSEEQVSTVAGADGTFRVTIETPAAGGPHELRVKGENEIVLTDVAIGEVWICSGQSNMEWRVTQSDAAAIPDADVPDIRLFDVVNTIGPAPREDCAGTWARCAPTSVPRFSAVGYFFGRELHETLNVPIGLIGANWGGTVAESWTSERTVRKFPEFGHDLDALEAARKRPEAIEAAYTVELEKWWKAVDRLVDGSTGWAAPDFDDSTWSTHEVPENWERTELGAFDGIVWYRKSFDVPADWAERELTLTLGPIDDMDTTWLNGRRIGGLDRGVAWNTPRRYRVPAETVRAGQTNVLTVRVFDSGGGGGFHGDAEAMRLTASEDQHIPLSGAWRYRAAASTTQLAPWPRKVSFHQNSPTALFNGMIAPLVPFAIRGAIWYQGESNRPRAVQYRRLFPAMITDWREHWGRGDFPFYFVQIAPFQYGGDLGEAAELREAQWMTQSLVNTGMAVTMDVGNPSDIHPRDKRTVGHRLALWALAKTYEREGIVYSGPSYRSMQVEDGAIRLAFDHAADGLVARGGELTHFTIAAEGGDFVPAQAKVDGDTIVVSSSEVKSPVAVRFAWGAADEPNLFNSAGLPASSFRTDDRRAVTAPD